MKGSRRLKYLAHVNPRRGTLARSISKKEEVVFLPMEKVSEQGQVDQSLRKPIKDLLKGFTYFERNDVLLAKITPCFENGKGALLENLETQVAFGSTEFHVLRANESGIDRRFLWYLTKSHLFRVPGEAYMQGSAGQKRVPESYVADFLVPNLSLKYQSKAASYLDRRIAEINSLIGQKERMLRLHANEKDVIIREAVCRGVNDRARLKPTDYHWLQQVPAHWTLKKLKWFALTTSGSTPPTSKQSIYYNGTIPWVRSTDLNDGELASTELNITKRALRDTSCKMLPSGSVMLAMYGGAGTIGKNAIARTDLSCNQAVCAILPNESYSSEFLQLYLKFYRPYWMRDAVGTRRDPNISQDVVRNLIVPFPPKPEQDQIVNAVHAKIGSASQLAVTIKESLALLHEYRESLINTAVSGKLTL